MSRTVKELRELMKDIPDDCIVWGYEGEVSGIVFSSLKSGKHTLNEYSSEKTAFLDNENKTKDEEWA